MMKSVFASLEGFPGSCQAVSLIFLFCNVLLVLSSSIFSCFRGSQLYSPSKKCWTRLPFARRGLPRAVWALYYQVLA
jgi:hypothetical protein